MGLTVYLNGETMDISEAKVPVEDRGFLFADAVYEVIRFYNGQLFYYDAHFQRLLDSLDGLGLPHPDGLTNLRQVCQDLIETNDLVDGTVYLQITRGSAPRTHGFPENPEPNFVVIARAKEALDPAAVEQGVATITLPDIRWGLCYLKTTGLLPNVLGKQRAHEEGAFEALLVRDGLVTEGTSSNVFMVEKGTIYTYPLANILPGVTRSIVLDLARKAGYTVSEQGLPLDRYLQANEVFLSGTTSEVMPVVSIDDQTIGSGSAGPVAMTLFEAYQDLIREHCG